MTWVPESCALPTVEQPLEIVSVVRDLVAREAGCCSFFSFDVRPSFVGTELEVRVPDPQECWPPWRG